ncbi:MAG: hypothetical protein JRJ10_15840, partial [Deltaproteobacteria bacterium]|nr:hypothetical protein [Deltaproteobacteria bacterium]
MSTDLLIYFGLPILLIVIGRLVGSRVERNHYENILERELRFRSQPALSTKGSGAAGPVRSATLATGSVVISVDHFKRFLSGFRMIF